MIVDDYLNQGRVDTRSGTGKVFEIQVSPVDPNLIFLLGDKGVNWLSEDCGETFKPLNNGRRIHDFEFHPHQRDWAIASIYTTCDDFDTPDECEIYKEIYHTKDLGVHWTFVTDHVLQFDWGVIDESDTYISDDTLIIVKHKNS